MALVKSVAPAVLLLLLLVVDVDGYTDCTGDCSEKRTSFDALSGELIGKRMFDALAGEALGKRALHSSAERWLSSLPYIGGRTAHRSEQHFLHLLLKRPAATNDALPDQANPHRSTGLMFVR
uniref:Uncharacterized protein n=1 Tax=Plectus sambesii TaxID=2011161 RepID=A0A914UQ59_9BILA